MEKIYGALRFPAVWPEGGSIAVSNENPKKN